MFARFDENPAMILQDIKETKRYGRTDGQTDNMKTVYPPQTKFAGGIISVFRVKGLLGRVGIHIFFNYIFSRNFLKMHKIIFVSRKPEKNFRFH